MCKEIQSMQMISINILTILLSLIHVSLYSHSLTSSNIGKLFYGQGKSCVKKKNWGTRDSACTSLLLLFNSVLKSKQTSIGMYLTL